MSFEDIQVVWTFLSDNLALAISTIAFILATLAHSFSKRAWSESNRPIVIARVRTDSRSDLGVALNLHVENTGNQPAVNVSLAVEDKEFKTVFTEQDDEMRERIVRCFGDSGKIPILPNGDSVSNMFGYVFGAPGETWKKGATLQVTVAYHALDGRSFDHHIPLKLSGDSGFAGTHWKHDEDDTGPAVLQS